jgi:hypothetical protein
MASRRTVTIIDRQRNSTARKRTHAAGLARQKQQAALMQKLVKAARAEQQAQKEA